MREWCGRSTKSKHHWNIGVHVYDDEGIDHKEVARVIDETLQKRFPSSKIIKSPKFEGLLEK